ncbi:MAG TPA: CaiB/BaiF CoA-transferase family protein, partial [Acidimicrobiales bacterium]|nr:CaiB/BaiF CoA-transferase family protein [Acidimicrobiales bacterium]
MSGPLTGLRVIELAGIGPCPFGAMVLADLGADVLRVERAAAVPAQRPEGKSWDLLQRGKRSIGVDLKHPAGVELVLCLAERADALVEGFRPGVTERLGLGPDVCLARNPRLVYGRMTGWGQEGPLADRAGHDIDYIAIGGALEPIGRAGERPVPPLNLIGDFGGGGMLLAVGVTAALWSAARSGEGDVIDVAMVDGSALLMTMTWAFRQLGVWHDERGTNLLDTGAPFYDTYECADGRIVAVGALEPQFYAQLLEVMGLDAADLPPQMDRAQWPESKRRYAEIFRTKTRDEWASLAEGTDACLAPVLSMGEAAVHPHNAARQTFVEVDGVLQPGPAPRFRSRQPGMPAGPRWPGEGGVAALTEWGIPADRVSGLVS